MAKQQNLQSQFYSIAGVAFYTTDNNPLGIVEVPGGLELAGVVGEAIPTRGGFSDYPVAARSGIKSGEVKLTLNECPLWLENAANGGSLSTLAADADGERTLPVDVGENTGMAAALSVGVIAGEPTVAGTFWVTSTGGSNVSIECYTEKGRYIFTGSSASTINLTGLGVSIVYAGSITAGYTAMFTTTPAHSGGQQIGVPAARATSALEYRLKAWSVARRSPQDALIEIEINRLIFLGMTNKLMDNEGPNGIELSMQMLAPLDGGDVWTKKAISPTA